MPVIISDEAINTLQSLSTGLSNPQHINVFLMGKKAREKYAVRNFVLNKQEDIEAIKDICENFTKKYKKIVEGDGDILPLGTDKEKGDISYTEATVKDKSLVTRWPQLNDKTIKFQNFLKKKYKHKFIIVDIPVTQDLKEKIVLIRRVRQSYKTSEVVNIKLFERSERRIAVTNPNDQLSLDHHFDIMVHFHENNKPTLLYIFNENNFEEIFEYTEKYEQAYIKLSTEFKFMQWPSNTPTSIAVKRQCYMIENSASKASCIEKMTAELQTQNPTQPTVKYLQTKSIAFKITDGKLLIDTKNVRDLRAVLHLVADRMVTTHYGKQHGTAVGFQPLS